MVMFIGNKPKIAWAKQKLLVSFKEIHSNRTKQRQKPFLTQTAYSIYVVYAGALLPSFTAMYGLYCVKSKIVSHLVMEMLFKVILPVVLRELRA